MRGLQTIALTNFPLLRLGFPTAARNSSAQRHPPTGFRIRGWGALGPDPGPAPALFSPRPPAQLPKSPSLSSLQPLVPKAPPPSRSRPAFGLRHSLSPCPVPRARPCLCLRLAPAPPTASVSPSHALPGPEAPPRPRPHLVPAPPPARVAVSRPPRAARPELARRSGGRGGIAAWGRQRSAGLGARESALCARICLPGCGTARSVRRSPRAGVSSRRGAGDQRGAAACWSAGGAVPGARGALRGTARPGSLCGAVFSNSPPPPHWAQRCREAPSTSAEGKRTWPFRGLLSPNQSQRSRVGSGGSGRHVRRRRTKKMQQAGRFRKL